MKNFQKKTLPQNNSANKIIFHFGVVLCYTPKPIKNIYRLLALLFTISAKRICDFASYLRKYPALQGGLCLLIGALINYEMSLILIIMALLFIFTHFCLNNVSRRQKILFAIRNFMLIVAMFVFTKYFAPMPEFTIPAFGKAHFSLENFKQSNSPFHTSYQFQGIIAKLEQNNGEIHRNLPITLSFSKKNMPEITSEYLLTGLTLRSIQSHRYFIEKGADFKCIPKKNFTNLPKLRTHLKKRIKDYIYKMYPSKEVAAFLSGIATGNTENLHLKFHFSKTGLSHLLAISGFHFALLSVFISLIFRFFVPTRVEALLQITLLGTYYLLIGFSPSVSRAFIAVAIFYIGMFLKKTTSAKNVFGVALFFPLLMRPSIVFHIGFQLSFAATFGIIAFYSKCNHFLERFFIKRKIDDLFPIRWQKGSTAIISSLFRKALALSLAINLTTAPILLFHFQSIPLLSVLYNLFFPALIGLFLFVFLFGSVLCFIPPLSLLIHMYNDKIIATLLDFVTFRPRMLEYYLFCPSFFKEFLYVYFIILIFCDAKKSDTILFSVGKTKNLFNKEEKINAP